jgi:hypothetical protein
MGMRAMKGLLLAIMLVYIFSPADLCLGLADDVVLSLLFLAAAKRNFGMITDNIFEKF